MNFFFPAEQFVSILPTFFREQIVFQEGHWYWSVPGPRCDVDNLLVLSTPHMDAYPKMAQSKPVSSGKASGQVGDPLADFIASVV